MRNRLVFILLIATTVLAMVGCGRSTPTDFTQPAPVVNDLPMLDVTKITGERISLREVPGRAVLIYFNPDCDHCQREAAGISERKQAFKDYAVYFISIDSMKNIARFAGEYKLTDSNFHFSQANSNDVFKYVGPLPTVPAIFIYNDHKLVKRLEGEVKLEELMKFL